MMKKMLLSGAIALSMVGLCATTASADVSYNTNETMMTNLYVDTIESEGFLSNYIHNISTNGIIPTNDREFADSQCSSNDLGGLNYIIDTTYASYTDGLLWRVIESPLYNGGYSSYISFGISHPFALDSNSNLRVVVPNTDFDVVVTAQILEYHYITNQWELVPKLYEKSFSASPTALGNEFDIQKLYNGLSREFDKTEFAINDLSIKFHVNNADDIAISVFEKYYTYEEYEQQNHWLGVIKRQANIQTPEIDYTSWLITAVGGFMAFEIVPGFTIGGVFSVIVMITLLIYILKMFLGG